MSGKISPKVFREIGSDFHLPLNHLWASNISSPSILQPENSQSLLMFNGRAALRLILRYVLKVNEGDEALLPAYLFNGLLGPFKESGMKIRFYKVNRDLSIDAEDITNKANPKTRVLLIIHYFGFPQPIEQLKEFRGVNPNICVLEDVAQSFFSALLDNSLGTFGDFSYNSYMKYIPTTDGSLLKARRPIAQLNWENEQLKRPTATWSRYFAMNFKNLYLKTKFVPKSWFLRLFRYSYQQLEEYPTLAPISRLSSRLINIFDWEKAITRRRDNYLHLLNNWESNSIVPTYRYLPDSVCPLGFIVYSENRDLVRKELAEANIYCPVHWPPKGENHTELLPDRIDAKEFPTSFEIANKILMIPIDHRYGLDEMNYVLEKINHMH